MSSCKKETNYGFWIGLDNKTDKELKVNVYPKSKFVNGEQYQVSSNNGYSEMKFTINPNGSENLYQSDKLDYKPELLLEELFDSISIEIKLDTTIVIKFKPNLVENYTQNMYSENSNWYFTLKEGSERTNLSSAPFEIHDYQFEIKKEEIK